MADICRNYHGGNRESESANASIETKKENLRSRIVEHLRKNGPRTCDRLEMELGLSHQTCSARCSELKRFFRVIVIGRAPTRSGRTAALLAHPDFNVMEVMAAQIREQLQK